MTTYGVGSLVAVEDELVHRSRESTDGRGSTRPPRTSVGKAPSRCAGFDSRPRETRSRTSRSCATRDGTRARNAATRRTPRAGGWLRLEQVRSVRAHLVPSRFVVVCGKGHIGDFPYLRWVHDGKAADGSRATSSTSGSWCHRRGLEGHRASRCCAARRTMDKSFDRDRVPRRGLLPRTATVAAERDGGLRRREQYAPATRRVERVVRLRTLRDQHPLRGRRPRFQVLRRLDDSPRDAGQRDPGDHRDLELARHDFTVTISLRR